MTHAAQLVDEAVAIGRRQGLEAAAEECMKVAAKHPGMKVGASAILSAIQARIVVAGIQTPNTQTSQHVSAAVVPQWISVEDRLPRIDGDALYIGINDQGAAGVFNGLMGVPCPSGARYWHCDYHTAEESVPVLSYLKWWMPLPAAPSQDAAPQSTPITAVQELIRRASDVLEGLEDKDLPGAMPVRVEKLRKAIADADTPNANAQAQSDTAQDDHTDFDTKMIAQGFDVSRDAYGEYHQDGVRQRWQGYQMANRLTAKGAAQSAQAAAPQEAKS